MISILQRLPGEILEQIWKEALLRVVIDITPSLLQFSPPQLMGETTDGSATLCAAKPSTRKCLPETSSILADLSALRLTCRELYHEATRLFFSHNNFHIHVSETTLSLPTRWLSSLPRRSRSQIKNLTIVCGAGEEDVLASLVRQTRSFDFMSASSFVNAPRALHDAHKPNISYALAELTLVDFFKHSAVTFRFDRQTAGTLEWSSWRRIWAQCLHDRSSVFTMPEREVLGCDAYERIVCAGQHLCGCGKGIDDEVSKGRERKDSLLSD